MKKKELNITKEEKERAAISIIKILSKSNVPIEDIKKLSGKNEQEIEKIINSLKKLESNNKKIKKKDKLCYNIK